MNMVEHKKYGLYLNKFSKNLAANIDDRLNRYH